MIPISSSLEGLEANFKYLRDQFETEDFHLGGGYTYEHGYFDKALDWEETKGNRYYLRIPVYAIDGELDKPETTLQIGQPFVIKHEFRTTNDPAGDSGLVLALVNQFSKPIPADHMPIDEKWISQSSSFHPKNGGKVISITSIGRGGRNRTHTRGFGDLCSTIKLRP